MASGLRQEQILDRTVELVARDGLANLTMKRIAERVGFSEAAIYRHFPTKQRLLLGLMDRLERLLLDPIRAIAADAGDSPSDRLARILTHHLRIVLDHDSLPVLLLAEASASGDPRLVQRMRDIFNPYRTLLCELLAHVAPTGRATAPRAPETAGQVPAIAPGSLALLLLGVPAALAIQHRLQPDRRAEGRAVAEVAPWLLAAITGGTAPALSMRTRR
jgi:AcrR family transcriptional regulator